MQEDQNSWHSATRFIKPTHCSKIYLTYLYNSNKTELEGILLQTGKAGGCVTTHLHAFFTLINYIIENNDYDDIMKALSPLTGSKCSFGDSCIDMIIKDIMTTMLSLQEDSQEEDEENKDKDAEI